MSTPALHGGTTPPAAAEANESTLVVATRTGAHAEAPGTFSGPLVHLGRSLAAAQGALKQAANRSQQGDAVLQGSAGAGPGIGASQPHQGKKQALLDHPHSGTGSGQHQRDAATASSAPTKLACITPHVRQLDSTASDRGPPSQGWQRSPTDLAVIPARRPSNSPAHPEALATAALAAMAPTPAAADRMQAPWVSLWSMLAPRAASSPHLPHFSMPSTSPNPLHDRPLVLDLHALSSAAPSTYPTLPSVHNPLRLLPFATLTVPTPRPAAPALPGLPPLALPEMTSEFAHLPPPPASYGGAASKAELGRATWTFLHTLAAQFPEQPTRQQQRDAKQLVELLTRIYPCRDCATHFYDIVKRDPPVVSSGREFQMWMCRIHNTVNRSIGKPSFNCDLVAARWAPLDCNDGQDASAPSGCDMSVGTAKTKRGADGAAGGRGAGW